MTDIDFDALQREDTERQQRLNSPTALRDAALWYATVAGWPVFPLTVAGKTPATRNGFKNATTDLEQIEGWWAQANYNIGTPTGIHFDVIDIDGPTGFRSYADILHADCQPGCCDGDKLCRPDRSHVTGLPILATAYTGGGGRHLLTPVTGTGNKAALLPGIDIRGAGGYIVLPPSVHSSGNRYDWIDPPTGELMQAAA